MASTNSTVTQTVNEAPAKMSLTFDRKELAAFEDTGEDSFVGFFNIHIIVF